MEVGTQVELLINKPNSNYFTKAYGRIVYVRGRKEYIIKLLTNGPPGWYIGDSIRVTYKNFHEGTFYVR